MHKTLNRGKDIVEILADKSRLNKTKKSRSKQQQQQQQKREVHITQSNHKIQTSQQNK